MEDAIENLVKRLSDAREAVMTRLRRRSWRWWAIAAVLVLALEEAGRALLSDSTINALIWLGEATWWLANRPLGYAGLFLVGFVLILIGVSWWETRPKPQPKQEAAEPYEPSQEEKQKIQNFRAIWERHGKKSLELMRRLFRDTYRELSNNLYWSEFLRLRETELTDDAENFEEELERNRSIEDIRESFNCMYASYINVCEWLAKLRHHEDIPEEIGTQPFDERLKHWEKTHALFTDKLKNLATDPTHKKQLNIFHASSYVTLFDKLHLYNLLNEAEDPFLAKEARQSEAETAEDND